MAVHGPTCSSARAEVKGELPPNNGPYRDGKGSVYEGGTRVVALANWPGRIKPGSRERDDAHRRYVPDLRRVWPEHHWVRVSRSTVSMSGPTISEGKPSPRDEMVYNVEPYRAAVRRGNWKLVWTTLLPPKIELFDLSRDPIRNH